MRPAQTPHAGFTLVELLVALMVMALLSLMAWRGLDGMARAQAATQTRADAMIALQNGLDQWSADLDAIADGQPTPLDWNGLALRIVRTSAGPDGPRLRVVAWSRRAAQDAVVWLRWQSAPLQSRKDVETAWQQAALWAQNPDDASKAQEVRVLPLADWAVYFYRGDTWSNPLSSSGANAELPDGVRLVLTLPSGGALAGTLTRDWVRATVAGNKQ